MRYSILGILAVAAASCALSGESAAQKDTVAISAANTSLRRLYRTVRDEEVTLVPAGVVMDQLGDASAWTVLVVECQREKVLRQFLDAALAKPHSRFHRGRNGVGKVSRPSDAARRLAGALATARFLVDPRSHWAPPSWLGADLVKDVRREETEVVHAQCAWPRFLRGKPRLVDWREARPSTLYEAGSLEGVFRAVVYLRRLSAEGDERSAAFQDLCSRPGVKEAYVRLQRMERIVGKFWGIGKPDAVSAPNLLGISPWMNKPVDQEFFRRVPEGQRDTAGPVDLLGQFLGVRPGRGRGRTTYGGGFRGAWFRMLSSLLSFPPSDALGSVFTSRKWLDVQLGSACQAYVMLRRVDGLVCMPVTGKQPWTRSVPKVMVEPVARFFVAANRVMARLQRVVREVKAFSAVVNREDRGEAADWPEVSYACLRRTDAMKPLSRFVRACGRVAQAQDVGRSPSGEDETTILGHLYDHLEDLQGPWSLRRSSVVLTDGQRDLGTLAEGRYLRLEFDLTWHGERVRAVGGTTSVSWKAAGEQKWRNFPELIAPEEAKK